MRNFPCATCRDPFLRGNRVEAATDLPGNVPVRDSKDLHGPALVFPAAGWSAFVSAVKGAAL
ncbi:DUF397 domain-containing protein [Streptomyces sp. NBC_01525]|uniref:DUF397 domain-containing protein n=1 Tax=Streptomyces benahoarensis TaxID=2595054 RepID=A0A553Z5B9_9ACTN|nr:DUF397 domain-containing protein [Streptomyces benahoarensis]TSB20130.1 DUF397 domain-containing protein [Streptomyces benahoarensis]TSB36644.1 DUF397 domain-containing protein [Streptomyces benahoarensis]